MNTVTIKGQTFQARKMPAFPEQLLFAKAMTPLAMDLLPLIENLIENPDMMEMVKQGKAPPAFLGLLLLTASNAMGKLTDDQLINLTRRALAAVQIKQGEAGWAAVMTDSGHIMFPDLMDLRTIAELVFKVAEVNLASFFVVGRGTSPAGQPLT